MLSEIIDKLIPQNTSDKGRENEMGADATDSQQV